MRFTDVLVALALGSALPLLATAGTPIQKSCGSAVNWVAHGDGDKAQYDMAALDPGNGECMELKHVHPFQMISVYNGCTCKLYKKEWCKDEAKVVEGDPTKEGLGSQDLNGADADYGYAICWYVSGPPKVPI